MMVAGDSVSRNPVGRPRLGRDKRVRTSFTLRPGDVAWLEEQATQCGQSKSAVLEACLALAKKELKDFRTYSTELVRKYPTVYWDVDSKDVVGELHSTFIIERMLEYGTLSGVRDLLIAFPRDQITQVVINSKRLSRKTALFWKSYFGIKDPIHCLRKESQNPLSKLWE